MSKFNMPCDSWVGGCPRFIELFTRCAARLHQRFSIGCGKKRGDDQNFDSNVPHCGGEGEFVDDPILPALFAFLRCRKVCFSDRYSPDGSLVMTDGETAAISISPTTGMVMLTMTPQRARLLAASIWLGDGDHRVWLNTLSTTMAAAAEGSGVFERSGSSEEARTAEVVAELDLPLPRDQVPAVDDPSYPADASSAAPVTPSESPVATALRAVTAQAAVEARQAVVEAAAVAAEAAKSAQLARTLAAAEAARAMEVLVSRAAVAVQVLSDARIQLARGMAEADRSTMMNIARETHVAAVTVARAAAQAAMQAATVAADSAMELELEVAATAAAVATVADVTADRLAARADTAAALLEVARGGGA